MNIMIVEDTEDSRVLLRDYFEAAGESAVTAVDGLEALGKIRAHQPDIIISDILMPRMDGFELCRTVKSDPAIEHIPFIFYTATYTEERDKKLALALGAQHFMIKPELPEVLHEVVKNVKLDTHSNNHVSLSENEFESFHKSVMADKLNKKVSELVAETALLDKKEQQLSLVVNAIPALVSHVDKDMRYKYVNDTYEKWHGIRCKEMIGRKVRDVIGEENWITVEPHIQTALRGELVEYEAEMVFQRQGTRHVWVRYVPDIGADGCVNGFVVVINDISDRVKMEKEKETLQKQLLQAQKMEAIGQLAGGIAHDFNNILTCIVGYSDLAYAGIKDRDKRNAEYLSEVIEGGRRAKELVAQLLEFSRGTIQETQVLNLETAVDDALRLTKKLMPTSVIIEFQKPWEIYRVKINPIQLQQVLMNLCINARDAMDWQGTITIKISMHDYNTGTCASCGAEVRGRYVGLSVQDIGTGLPEGVVGKIFQPFYTTKEAGKGSGMGLSVVHGIMHDANGHILVTTAHGAGSKFVLLFPTLVQGAVVIENSPVAFTRMARATKGVRIMVIDDEISIGNYLRELLALYGHEVDVFYDPAEALAAFKERPNDYKLVLTDYIMPTMSGLELAIQLRQYNDNAAIMLCTGFSDKITEDQIRESGISYYFTKPFSSKMLLDKVQELVS